MPVDGYLGYPTTEKLDVYLGYPIDGAQPALWPELVIKLLDAYDLVAFDPRPAGIQALKMGLSHKLIWEVSQANLDRAEFALFEWGGASVGVHAEVIRRRDSGRPYSVWNLTSEQAKAKIALHGVEDHAWLTLATAMRVSVIPLLANVVGCPVDRMMGTWDSIFSFRRM